MRGLGLPGCGRGVTVPISSVDVDRVLIQARGEPDAIRKGKSHRLDRRRGDVQRGSLCDAKRRRDVEAREREFVRRLGIELEQQRAKKWVEHG